MMSDKNFIFYLTGFLTFWLCGYFSHLLLTKHKQNNKDKNILRSIVSALTIVQYFMIWWFFIIVSAFFGAVFRFIYGIVTGKDYDTGGNFHTSSSEPEKKSCEEKLFIKDELGRQIELHKVPSEKLGTLAYKDQFFNEYISEDGGKTVKKK